MEGQGVKLYSSWFCPFAQRAWISLLEKNVKFELVEIDPYNKTPEFLATNPKGLVPVLVQNGRSVYESAICIEYVDEMWPDPPRLLPKDPYDRAQVRIWSDFIAKKIVPQYYIALQRQTKPEQEEAIAAILKSLAELVKYMSADGPYFRGKDFGMVDIMLFPYTYRADVILGHYRGFKFPQDDTFARIQEWMKACLSKDSVKATMATDEKYIAIYERYAKNVAKTEVADAVRKGTGLP